MIDTVYERKLYSFVYIHGSEGASLRSNVASREMLEHHSGVDLKFRGRLQLSTANPAPDVQKRRLIASASIFMCYFRAREICSYINLSRPFVFFM